MRKNGWQLGLIAAIGVVGWLVWRQRRRDERALATDRVAIGRGQDRRDACGRGPGQRRRGRVQHFRGAAVSAPEVVGLPALDLLGGAGILGPGSGRQREPGGGQQAHDEKPALLWCAA